jgi:hypothetical protein
VDAVSDSYLEFRRDRDGDLKIHPGGADFFYDIREKLLKDVCQPDTEKVRGALGKANLLAWAGQEEPEALSFLKLKNGTSVPYSLQIIRTRESDARHIVIGVRRE